MSKQAARLLALASLGLALFLSPGALAYAARPTATVSTSATPTPGTGGTTVAATPMPTRAAPPELSLPTPADETWQVIQGYNCGTHDDWGQFSFDIVNSDPAGRTSGAPVFASADASLWYWHAQSGSLILSHGQGYFTMYTHMQSHIDLPRGAPIARGTQIGTVGNVGAEHTVPHLHFTFFYGNERGGEGREPLPLRFVEGYDFPDQGLCNNYGGSLLTATLPQTATLALASSAWVELPPPLQQAVAPYAMFDRMSEFYQRARLLLLAGLGASGL